jgi:hypothetical protein
MIESTVKKPARQPNYYRKWLILSPLSLMLVGYGLCEMGDALTMKWEHQPVVRWLWWGTYSLVVINAGLCLLGEAIKCRVHYELERKAEK